MAKIYAELSSHERGRIVSKSSNVRLMVNVYQANKVIGALKVYPIADETNGHRITWQGLTDHHEVMIQNTDTLK